VCAITDMFVWLRLMSVNGLSKIRLIVSVLYASYGQTN